LNYTLNGGPLNKNNEFFLVDEMVVETGIEADTGAETVTEIEGVGAGPETDQEAEAGGIDQGASPDLVERVDQIEIQVKHFYFLF